MAKLINLNSILRMQELSVSLKLSKSTIYSKINPKSKYYDPTFPKPISLGERAVGWYLSDVNAWLEAKH